MVLTPDQILRMLGSEGDPTDTAGGGSGGVSGGGTGADYTGDRFWPGAADYFADAWEAREAYSRWIEDRQRLSEEEAQAEYERRRDEGRAYAEEQQEESRAYAEEQYRQRLAESLARQLTSQHGRQEEAWAAAAGAAPGRGAYLLESKLPQHLPRSVGESLLKWGQEMGAGYDPRWPGGTALGEAQITPSGQSWIDYLKQQGYPGYLWE